MVDNVNPIQPITPVDSPTGKAKNPATDNAEFRRILERLESLSKGEVKPPTEKFGDSSKFLDAMRKADDDFASVMDLRRRLEDAYRKGKT